MANKKSFIKKHRIGITISLTTILSGIFALIYWKLYGVDELLKAFFFWGFGTFVVGTVGTIIYRFVKGKKIKI